MAALRCDGTVEDLQTHRTHELGHVAAAVGHALLVLSTAVKSSEHRHFFSLQSQSCDVTASFLERTTEEAVVVVVVLVGLLLTAW